MGSKNKHFRYRLGIDVGVASLGIAILELKDSNNRDTGEPDYSIFGGSVRTYPIPEGAAERREKRGMRRNIERRERRLDRLSVLLAANGVGYRRKEVPKNILDLSPIKLRAKASREKVELAHLSRALLHIARHRGSSAFRESDIKKAGEDRKDKEPLETTEAAKEKKEQRQTALAIKSLRAEMAAKGFLTYGQYLRWREKQVPTPLIRINQEKMADSKDGYAYYPSREMLQEEFNVIWDKQADFYPETLTRSLKEKVEDELFFQRAITSPPPGKCPYFTNETRLARSSRLFQIRRIYEETNHLRFSAKNGGIIAYGIEARDKIVARLMAGEDLTFAEIKNTIDLKRTDKVSIEDTKTRKGINGYPFDRDLGAPEALGGAWLQADEDTQDKILAVLATEHDDAKAVDALTKILNGDREAAKRALEIPLPPGWGRMGLTATVKILAELKKDVAAEDRAGLVHAMTADGVIYDRLPYYGEILIGHTVEPMWVSDYRRKTDRPPNTAPEEQKFGRIPNPVVHLALNQIRRTVNAVIRKYGLPEFIHIELARELNKSAEARDEIAKQNEKNRKASDEAAKELAEIKVTVNRLNIQKYKLWKEQGSECIYTGKPLNLASLYNGEVDIDHILPRSKTFLDSMANKAVCLRSANADKNNRAPYDAFADTDNPNYDWDAIMRRVEKLPKNKQWRFEADAMKMFKEDEEGYRARYGTDNSYIARVARQYLACLYGEQHKIVAVSSYIVAMLRGKWGLQKILGSKKGGKKARDDHRHHFIDALTTACATRGMVQRIMREAARCENKQLDDFVKTIAPPFGDPKEFVNAAREATFERVTLSRKADHSRGGQLHEDTLMGIVDVDGPDKNGKYVCRKRKKLADYNTLEKLEQSKIENTLPDIPKIEQARENLEAIKESVRDCVMQATDELEEERAADIASGMKGKNISEQAVYSRAVQLHKDAGGKTAFTLYKKKKLVNVRRAGGGNRPTGGYISGRNHRKDFYLDKKGKLKWQLISMMDANDKNFIPEAEKPGNSLLWPVHKEDVLEMDDPEDAGRRIRVVVAKFGEARMGVIPEADARADTKGRILWENGLKYFREKCAQRVVTDALGEIIWRFPALPRSGKAEPES